MLKKNMVDGITVLFVILFLYTGISKLLDYSVFKEQIATSPVLAPVASLIAVLLPITEILVVVLLAIPRWRLKGLYASSVLMMLFTVYITGILLFNKEIPCSCGGAIDSLSWNQHILFNVFFIVIGIGGLILEKQLKIESKNSLRLVMQ